MSRARPRKAQRRRWPRKNTRETLEPRSWSHHKIPGLQMQPPGGGRRRPVSLIQPGCCSSTCRSTTWAAAADHSSGLVPTADGHGWAGPRPPF
ncbi:unnamed protein product [Urochloa humidicola]